VSGIANGLPSAQTLLLLLLLLLRLDLRLCLPQMVTLTLAAIPAVRHTTAGRNDLGMRILEEALVEHKVVPLWNGAYQAVVLAQESE